MGQKNSIYEYCNISQELRELKTISKQFESMTKKMVQNSSQNIKNNFDEISNSEQQQPKPDDLSFSDNENLTYKNVDTLKPFDDKDCQQNLYIVRDLYSNLNADSLSFVLNTSITEISRVTAMKMMKKFEESANIDNLVQNKIIDINEKLCNDNLSEEDYRTISYENLAVEQLAEYPETCKRDSSTYTVENNETVLVTPEKIEYNDNIDILEISNDKITNNINKDETIKPCKSSIKKEEIENSTPKAEEMSNCSKESDVDKMIDIIPQKNKNELELNMMKKEITYLKENLNKLRLEQKEAQSKLKVAEHKCNVYKMESQIAEATFHYMQDKLRIITKLVNAEVDKCSLLKTSIDSPIMDCPIEFTE